MGYDLHITRKQNWFDDDETASISIGEWKEYVAKDAEMRLDNYAEASLPDGNSLKVENDGLSVWTAYSGDGIDGNYAWFDYRRGNIIVKNPDEEIIRKMLNIADQLRAKVQGDEGEIYTRKQ